MNMIRQTSGQNASSGGGAPDESWIDGIIDSWEQTAMPVQPYVAGTWGPTDAVRLLDRDDRQWCQPHGS